MSVIDPTVTYTKTAWKKYERAMGKLDDIHVCGDTPTIATVSSPGFKQSNYQGIGTSVWCCATCLPLVEQMMDDAFGGHVTTHEATEAAQ